MLQARQQSERVTYLVLVQPLDDLVALLHDLVLVLVADLILDLLILHGGLHLERVALYGVLGGDTIPLGLVVLLVFLGVGNHPLDVLLGETTLVVGDGDLVLFAGAGVAGDYVEDTVGVDVKGDLDLWDTTGCWWDAGELELAEKVL